MSAQKSEDLESVGKVLYRPVELDKETTPLQGNPAVPATTPADDIKLESIKDLLTSKESSQDGLRSLTVNKLSKSKSNEDANVSDSLVLMNLQTSKPVPVLPQPDITPSFEVTPKPEIEQEEEKDVEKETYEEDSGLRLLEETTTEARRSRWSDDDEAGGLPRSESQIFRLQRAIRSLFCCGIAYERPSEDEQYDTRSGFPM